MSMEWRIRDIIDLEYFLGFEAQSQGKTGFDRDVYLSYSETGPAPPSRRELIRNWLERRREVETEQNRDAVLPGAVYIESIVLLRVFLAFIALVLGTTLTWSLFSYKGEQPINVFTCLWVLVVPQVLLLILLLVLSIFRRVRIIRSFILIYPLTAAIARRLFNRVGRIMANRMSADRQDRFRSTAGLVGQVRTIYGSLFFWPIFLTAQLFGIAFNLGALGALLLRVTITDLAFGWQSTLQPGPETVHRVVQTISIPWGWLVDPPLAHPTMAQIAGTKMVLKEGIFHLATGDLVAWWPFLAFAILFYGFVPRFFLLTGGWFLQRRVLKKLDFGHAACDRLVQRMQTPRLETDNRLYVEKVTMPPPSANVRAAPPENTATFRMGPAIVMIPEELLQQLDPDEAADRIRSWFAMDPVETLPAEIDSHMDGRRLYAALQAKGSDTSIRVVILQEAWQPPIKETLSWLKGMRNAAGKTVGLIIALIGKPANGTIFTPPSEIDQVIWEQAVQSLGDPYLRVESLGRS